MEFAVYTIHLQIQLFAHSRKPPAQASFCVLGITGVFKRCLQALNTSFFKLKNAFLTMPQTVVKYSAAFLRTTWYDAVKLQPTETIFSCRETPGSEKPGLPLKNFASEIVTSVRDIASHKDFFDTAKPVPGTVIHIPKTPVSYSFLK